MTARGSFVLEMEKIRLYLAGQIAGLQWVLDAMDAEELQPEPDSALSLPDAPESSR